MDDLYDFVRNNDINAVKVVVTLLPNIFRFQCDALDHERWRMFEDMSDEMLDVILDLGVKDLPIDNVNKYSLELQQKILRAGIDCDEPKIDRLQEMDDDIIERYSR